MAKIITLGSSSQGNGYVIDADGEYLILECGVPLREALKACDYKSTKIRGCLTSHVHSDHAKYLDDYQKRMEVISNWEVADKGVRCTFLPERNWIHRGGFSIYAFYLPHDAVNYGYIIKHKAFGSLFFGTDCWNYPNPFLHVDHFLVEANYRDDLLDGLDAAQRNRLMVSHMSLDYCIKYLHQCKAEESAKTITLIHLSSRHSNADEFKEQVQKEFGVPTYIADKGVIIDISKEVI